MQDTSALSTFKFSDSAFYTLESAVMSVISNTRDNCTSELKVSVGGNDVLLSKKSKSRKPLDTVFPASAYKQAEQKASQICDEIEYNFSSCIATLGEKVWEVASPVLLQSRSKAEFVIDSNGKRKRVRRRPEELKSEKKHLCPYAECDKCYTSKCSLYLHIKRHHHEEEILKDGEIAPIRINSKVKKGVNIYKVFKEAQAAKYECRATNLSTTNSTESENVETMTSSDKIKRDIKLSRGMSQSTYCFSSQESPVKNENVSEQSLLQEDLFADCEFEAQDEIFSWEVSHELRKSLNASIIVQDPINRYENAIEYDGEYISDIGIEIDCNQEMFYSEDSCYDGEFHFGTNSAKFEYLDDVNSNESVDHERNIDFIDMSTKEDTQDTNSMFDFEFEFNGISRKVLKI